MTENILPRTNQGVLPVVWKLLHLRWLIFVNDFRRAKMRRKIGLIILAVIILGLVIGAFYLSWFVLRFLQSPQLAQYIGDRSRLEEGLPVLFFEFIFIGLLLTSFGVLLQALYLAGDMDFLLSIPVPMRAVFITKLLQAILPNFSIVCLLAIPVLYGLGFSLHYNFFYFLALPLILAAMALAAAGLASLLVMAVVRIFPARRVAEVLGFIGAITVFLCSQSGQLMGMGNFSAQQAQAALGMVDRMNTAWLPIAWAGRGLTALGRSEWISGLGTTILVLGVCGLIFGVALVTAERLYYNGWASMQGNLRKRKPLAASEKLAPRLNLSLSFLGSAGRWLPSEVGAIVAKDFRVLRRDLRNLSQLVTPLILGVIYAVMLLRDGNRTPPSEEIPAVLNYAVQNLSLLLSIGISLFVGWSLQWRLAGMGFSQEGKDYWLIKTAPVSPNRLLAAKYLVAYLPTLTLGWIFLFIITLIQNANLKFLWFSIPVVALSIAGNAGINLAFGVVGTRLDWEDPRQMQRGVTGCLGSLASVVYLPTSLLLFFGPAFLANALGSPEFGGQLIGLVLGGTFSLVCVFLPLAMVRQRVVDLGEE